MALLAPGGAQAAGTLDQQQTVDNRSVDAGGPFGASYAQIFTAGLTGSLDQVDVLLAKVAGTTAAFTVQIQAVSGGVPSGSVLGTTTVSAASVPDSSTGAGWITIPIGPVAVTAGTQYAIVLLFAPDPAA